MNKNLNNNCDQYKKNLQKIHLLKSNNHAVKLLFLTPHFRNIKRNKHIYKSSRKDI